MLFRSLPHSPTIFIDKGGIETGDVWADKLKKALATSKCLVPIFIGPYFNSEWCSREFAIIHNRQNALGFGTIDKPGGLIIPVLAADGDTLHAHAKRLQSINFKEFYTDCESFKKSLKYMDFEAKIKELTHAIIKTLENVPEWDAEWLEEKWLDNVNIKDYHKPNPIYPTLNPTLR